jgi:type II secretory pathway pseudopilin PulG
MSNFKFINSDNGFGLIGIMVGLIIISVMMAAALPYLNGFNEVKQAKAAINMANGLINSEIQYQQASYSNDAENNSTPSDNDYFGTIAEMVNGMKILPNNNEQQFLPQGISLSQTSYQGNDNCIEKLLGRSFIAECLKDESSGQFEVIINGLNGSNSEYIPMFKNGVKGGVSAYSQGVLITQVSVPFGFSAYPKIKNGNGNGNAVKNSTVNNNTYIQEQQAAAAASANESLIAAAETAANNAYYKEEGVNSLENLEGDTPQLQSEMANAQQQYGNAENFLQAAEQ